MTTNIKVDKRGYSGLHSDDESQGQTVSEAEVTALITLMLPNY